jgi:hypothetical protein
MYGLAPCGCRLYILYPETADGGDGGKTERKRCSLLHFDSTAVTGLNRRQDQNS